MSNTPHFERLFRPIRLGEMEVKNRFVMAPMATNFSTKDGFVTEQMKAYYAERARGGVGLIIVEEACVDAPVGKGGALQLYIDDDKHILGLKQLVDIIHRHGAKAAKQLHHAGRLAATRYTNCQPVAPSAIAAPGGDMPRELSIAEIEAIVDKFAEAAERAKKAGFDGMEIQACHGYLLSNFLSADSNKRQDAYGGSLRNRAKLLLDVVDTVRNKVGTNYPVWVRLCAQEFHTDNGIKPNESQQLARWLEEAGVIALDVSADYHRAAFGMAWKVEGEKTARPPAAHPHGYLIPWAESIKKVVNIPVVLTGWMTPEVGEQAIREGKIDMVGMARPLLADPEIPNKVASGRLGDIRPCIGCLKCRDLFGADKAVACSVNASAGREYAAPIVPKKKKRVIVVGGGPAGLEAARVAALRGHSVTLFDKAVSLGGQLIAASLPPHKGVLAELISYLTTQVNRLGIKVELGREATPEVILKARPNAVVVASGVTPIVPELPGVEMAKVVDAMDVLTGKAKVGAKVVIIGGDLVGCETAEFLADKGKKVTVCRRGPEMATGISVALRRILLKNLNDLGVTLLPGVKYEEITSKGLVLTIKEGERRTIEAESVVLAAGSQPNRKLFDELKAKVPEIHIAGDCVEPRGIFEAIAEGFRAGQAI